MRALTLIHKEMTRENLLEMAAAIPGAWMGIRIAAYLLILKGWRSSQVADLFGLTRCAVVKWIRKGNEIGVQAVEDRFRPGRPSLFDEQLRKELDEVLSKSPKDFGIPRVRWDGIVLAEYLKRFHQITIHIRHAQRWIRKLGYSLRQPVYRFVQASDEGVEAFRQELKKLQLMKRGKRKRVILFEDESGFSLHPKLGRVWAKKGSQPYVYTRSQHQKRLNLFGWVAPFQGWHGMIKRPKGNTEGFLKLLHHLLARFKESLIDLWVDRAKWHRGERVERFRLACRRLRIHYLPPYHPELNFQETLWRTMRYEETTNSFFETIEHLEISVFKRSRRWKPQKIKSLCKLT